MIEKLKPLPSRKPTPKQKRFIQAYIKTGNATQAALQAYKASYSTARSIGYENLTKPHIRREIEKSMVIKVQLTTQDALRTVKDALEANRDKGPDSTARLKAADMTLKLADAYPKDRPQAQETHLDQQLEQLAIEIPENEPLEVIDWLCEHNRLPDAEERRKLLGDGKTKGEVGE